MRKDITYVNNVQRNGISIGRVKREWSSKDRRIWFIYVEVVEQYVALCVCIVYMYNIHTHDCTKLLGIGRSWWFEIQKESVNVDYHLFFNWWKSILSVWMNCQVMEAQTSKSRQYTQYVICARAKYTCTVLYVCGTLGLPWSIWPKGQSHPFWSIRTLFAF